MGRLFVEHAVAEKAAHVVLWDVDRDALERCVGDLEDRGVPLHAYEVDLGDADLVAATADLVREDVGDPDIVINNAGIVRGNAYFWENDPVKDIETTMRVNAIAPMLVARAFLPGMIASGRDARLLDVASAAGLIANPRMAAYCGSKWAVIGWSESVRLELQQAGHHRVKVTTLCPYYVKTGMFAGASSAPLLPLLEPQEVVDTAWREMKKGTAMVLLPRTVLAAEVTRGILPTPVRDFLMGRVFGIQDTMKNFTGRPATH